jgi:UDP-N-acetylglucosamine--N-acetylmuramyl-(pentapeptide) pyrophosphoryl-undecaprenol N-acetylglucosamine transferase
MKIIISGGGTGGHIYPAIAIAQTLQKQFPTCKILFVGAEGKMEMEKVPKAGFEIIGLPVRALQRSLSLENLKFPFLLLRSLWKAYKIVQDFEPAICIGVGGYASGAVMQVAVLQGIPTLIMEQNSYAGLTNKILSKFVDKICVAYPHMEQYFPKHKIVLTGNPIRSDLFNLRSIKPEALQFFGLENTKKTLLIIGGSLGARTINQAIIGGIEKLLAQNYQIIWQTGNTDFGRIQTALSEKNLLLNSNLVVKDFMYAMQFAYAAADVVISRAGALAISELCLAEKPAILIPLPSAAEDHQTKNANTLVEKDAALLVKDSEAKEILVQTAIHLLENIALQTKLQTNIQTFAKPNAAQEIVQEIVKLLQ